MYFHLLFFLLCLQVCSTEDNDHFVEAFAFCSSHVKGRRVVQDTDSYLSFQIRMWPHCQQSVAMGNGNCIKQVWMLSSEPMSYKQVASEPWTVCPGGMGYNYSVLWQVFFSLFSTTSCWMCLKCIHWDHTSGFFTRQSASLVIWEQWASCSCMGGGSLWVQACLPQINYVTFFFFITTVVMINYITLLLWRLKAMDVQVSMMSFSLFGVDSGSGLARSYESSILKFPKKLYTNFPSGCIGLPSHQQW